MIYVTVIVVLAATFMALKLASFLRQGRVLAEPGFTSKPASLPARLVRSVLARLALRLVIGRITIKGGQHLRHNGRLLIMPTHQILQDAIVMAAILGTRQCRYLLLDTQITPLRAPFAAWFGAIVVHKANKWLGARKAIRALRSEPDSSLLVFPQGRRMHEKPLDRADFQDGALFIGKQVEVANGLPMPAVSIAISYDRNPDNAVGMRRLLRDFGLESWLKRIFSDATYGVTVVIDQVRPLASYGDNLQSGTDKIFQRAQELEAQAKALSSKLRVQPAREKGKPCNTT